MLANGQRGPAAWRSHSPDFGVMMIASPDRVEEVGVFRRLAPVNVLPMIGLLSIMVPATLPSPSRAQTNIDQGKTAAELFAGDCAACHKTTRGLANGRNSLTLSIFLREHYTASSGQAAALAAYVLSSGGNSPAPKPTVEHARTEEPKTQEPKTQEPKTQESKTQESKTQQPGNQEHRNQEPKGQEARTAPPAGPHQRGHEETPPAEQAPAPVVATPSEPATAAPGPTTSAAAPAESEPSDNAPVPRDNIPD
jgi:hypothetical protein